MRGLLIGALATTAVGCNWVFGLGGTTERPPPDAPGLDAVASLTWLVATTAADGHPLPADLVPLDPAPAVRIGTLDGALAPAAYGPGGEITFPASYLGQRWRLEYTIERGVPHEVQWAPAHSGEGHLVVPRFGRLDRAPVPPGSGYSVSLELSGPAVLADARLFTSGVWTDTPLGMTAFPLEIPFAGAVALSGPLGAPEPDRGDRGAVVDFAAGPQCRLATGSMPVSASLVAGMASPVAGSWDASTTSIAIETTGPTATLTDLLGGGAVKSRLQIGFTPSSTMPAYTQAVAGLALPAPLMLAMADCAVIPTKSSLAIHLQGVFKAIFPQVGLLQDTSTRQVSGGPALVSGIASVAPVLIANVLTIEPFLGGFPIAPIQLGATNLDGADHVPLEPGTAALPLTFAVTAPGADYYDVTLFRVVGTALTAVRIYTVTAPAVRVDRSDLARGGEYVLEIRGYVGRPDAQRGDFRAALPSQQLVSRFTRTFVVP